MIRCIVEEGGEDLARYLKEIHAELRALREEAHKLRLVNQETQAELARLNYFRRRILDAVDQESEPDVQRVLARLR